MIEVHVREDGGFHLLRLLFRGTVLAEDIGRGTGCAVERGKNVLDEVRREILEVFAHTEIEDVVGV